MKSIGFVIISVLLFCSCQNSSVGRTISDTSVVAFRPLGSHGRSWTGGTMSFTILNSKDTFNWKIFQMGDTMRTVNGKPIYDSLHKVYKLNSGWSEIPEDTLKKFQIIYFPK